VQYVVLILAVIRGSVSRNRQSSRERQLSSDQVVESALALADEQGLERLTMRGLANALGVGTMTLYGYFRSKDEVLDAMADFALGRLTIDPPAGDKNTPAEAVRAVGIGFRRMMQVHPSVVQILSTRVTDSPQARQGAMEAVLDRLIASGIPGPLAVSCYGFLMVFTLGFSSYQSPRPWGHVDREDQLELIRQRTHYYASLPIDKFPLLIALKDSLVTLPSDDQFEFGLQCLSELVEIKIQA